jgi:hypothetical protein
MVPCRAHRIRVCLIAIGVLSLAVSSILFAPRPRPRSCATFVMTAGDAVLVGHNLDEANSVPGLVVVNPRGLAKSNWTYGEIKAGRQSASSPRLRWTSRYASLTYNPFGREFPDGGFNEAGLYVGEMTLMSTKWPEGGSTPRLYHYQWTQYLLDNFATADEALSSLDHALPEGHCKWHFLLADRTGKTAVVEFLDGKAKVYKGSALPYPILCNDAYGLELDDIKTYQGFGGTKDPVPRYPREDPRFRWAAVMLAADKLYPSPVDRAYAVLDRMDFGTTKWKLVCDLAACRMTFLTNDAAGRRWADLRAFDAACTAAPMALDIHRDLKGDVAKAFAPLTPDANREAVARTWDQIDIGTLGNLFFKPRMVKGIPIAAESAKCEGAKG